MLAKLLASILLVQAVIAQEQADEGRRLRFRRPRPKLIEVDDPEGELEGSPVPILIPEESAQVFNSAVQSRGNAALEALIATAQKEEAPPQPAPVAAPIVEIPVEVPTSQEPVSPLRTAGRPATGNRRRVPGVPRRRRPRPERPASEDGEAPQERPRGRPRGQKENVATLERYSHKNDDGSFTFGYVGADGSFREETRGVDCITRGKYGYIDPDGVKREYTYTSGLPCEIGEDGEQLQNIDSQDINVEDPVDPAERFRQTQNVQLTADEIPEARRVNTNRVRGHVRRPQPESVAAPAAVDNSAFSNFGANRAQVPQRRPVAQSGSALENLLSIADGSQPSAPAPIAPVARPAPRPTARTAIPQRIQPAATPVRVTQPGTFDFDSELEGFTLNRPSLTFEQNRNENADKPSTSFQSQLVFDQQTGTFQTQLQQNIPGSAAINLQNAAAPFTGVQTTTPAPITDNAFTLTTRVTPAPTTIAARPTPTIAARPTTNFAARPTPTIAAQPAPAPVSGGVLPAGTFKLDFEPLNIPAAAPAAPARPSPVPTTINLPTTVNLPTPTQPASRAPAPVPATPAAAPAPARPQNTFFVFQPFNQGGQPLPSPRPASNPFQTPLNPNAFTINRPQVVAGRPAAPQGVPQARPAPPQAARPAPLQAARPAPPQAAPQPQVLRPQVIPQRVNVPAPAAPPAFQAAQPQAAPGQPQLQFGFQPVQQQQQPARNVPFTAFRTGTPPQIQAIQQRPAAQPQQLGGAPVRFQGASQLGVPPQLQAVQTQEQPRFAPQPSRPASFAPQQFGGAQPFSVFNPTQLRGA